MEASLDVLKRFSLLIFREGGGKGEREGEKYHCLVPCVCPQPGMWPSTQACALTGNRTSNPLVLRPELDPLSHTSQGRFLLFNN